MSEYWQSTPKHFCKFCNAWMNDNKQSIRLHEQGAKHKQAMEEFFKAKRDAKRQGSINDSQASKELREIEKAALAAAAADAAMFGGGGVGGGGASALVPPPPPPRPQAMLQPPPPPPPRPPQPDYNQGFRRDKEKEEEDAAAAAAANAAPPEPEGRYTVDGVTYLEGKHFGEMLVTGTECQLWVEAADQWANARILKVTVTAVPNTKLVLRKFAVAYRFAQEGGGDGGEGEEREEDDVNADRLRMIEAQVVEAAAPPPPPVDTYTGLGGWQTVSVREVDEEAERLASEEAIKQETQRRKELDEKRRMRMMEEALEGEDAMSSYDPHGRGYYKGVNLNATTTGAEEVSATAEVNLGGDADGPVAFKKKRKTGGGGGGGAAKFRRKRTADEDD